MYISQSASSTPTPRSTSRVMMTGLIGLDLRREDWSGPSHDDWRKTCLMESCRWNPAEKLGISHGRSSKDGYHTYRVPPTISLGFPLLKICGSRHTRRCLGMSIGKYSMPIAEPAVGRAS